MTAKPAEDQDWDTEAMLVPEHVPVAALLLDLGRPAVRG